MEADVNELIALGLKGVKIHPDIQKVKLDDYRLLKMYELCEGRLPILIHTGDNRYDYSNPNRMLPILDSYPNLTVIGAHFGGWSIWEDAWRDYAGRENFYVDCSSSLYAIKPETAVELIHAYGADRVLFGTDYPLWTPESEIERFMKLDLTESEREDILCNNAARLFGITL
jgi:predicted TIM-barrel fold metal-dependent hydrolase